jgi:hypothetical protein
MKFIGYFDINGMSPHQAISHLTEKQQDNYRLQIAKWLSSNHFIVDIVSGAGVDLALISESIITMQETPAGPMPVQVPRLRLQYTVNLQPSPTAPQPSGLILPGQQNGQLNMITLVPLPEETDAP